MRTSIFCINLYIGLLFLASCNSVGDIELKVNEHSKGNTNSITSLRSTTCPEEYVETEFPDLDSIQLSDIEFEPLEVQIIVFNQISPEKRLSIINERLEKAKLQLTSVQVQHVEQLDTFLTIEVYQDTVSSPNQNFFSNWIQEAWTLYAWPQENTIQLLFTLSPLDQVVTFWDFEVSSAPNDPADSGKNCVCRWDAFCSTFANADGCQNFGCKTSRWGCGGLLLGRCTGRCW